MDKKRFRLFRALIAMVVAGAVGWSVSNGNIITPLIAVAAGLGLFYWLKRRVNDVIEDERVHRIGEKAARLTISILPVTIAVAGAILLALGQRGLATMRIIGLTLGYVAIAFTLVYAILYAYYERKI